MSDILHHDELASIHKLAAAKAFLAEPIASQPSSGTYYVSLIAHLTGGPLK